MNREAKYLVAFILGVVLSAVFMPRPAKADGGLYESAHRMAVALERIATVLESKR